MTANKSTFKKLMTPEFRVSFPNINKPNEKGMYNVVMLIPKTTDITALKNAVIEAVTTAWPDPSKRPPQLTNPIKDGDTDRMQDGTLRCEKYPEMKGHWVLSAMSKSKPGLVDANVVPIINPEDFYAGCFARATVHTFTFAPSQKNPQCKYGVGLGLDNIQKLRDGEAFSGKSRAEDDFGPVQVQGAAPQVQQGGFESMFG